MYMTYKLAQVLLQPEVWIMVCLVTGWVVARVPQRALRGWRLVVLAGLLFYGLGTRPLHDLLIRPLEAQYPSLALTVGPSHDALVVLGGGVARQPGSDVPTLLGTASLPRLLCGVTRWHAGVASVLVLSSGVGDPFRRQPPEAEVMRDVAIRLGVPEAAIRIEPYSRTTAENAVEVRRLLPEAQHIVLVTSAIHLPRATALFRKQGFEVTPDPCDYHARTGPWKPLDFLPHGKRLTESGGAIHEYVGLALFRVLGRL